jgi:hypothetical protein
MVTRLPAVPRIAVAALARLLPSGFRVPELAAPPRARLRI